MRRRASRRGRTRPTGGRWGSSATALVPPLVPAWHRVLPSMAGPTLLKQGDHARSGSGRLAPDILGERDSGSVEESTVEEVREVSITSHALGARPEKRTRLFRSALLDSFIADRIDY